MRDPDGAALEQHLHVVKQDRSRFVGRVVDHDAHLPVQRHEAYLREGEIRVGDVDVDEVVCRVDCYEVAGVRTLLFFGFSNDSHKIGIEET